MRYLRYALGEILLGRLEELLRLLAAPGSDASLERQRFIHSVAYTYWYLRVAFSGASFEQDFMRMLEEPAVFEPLVAEGRYRADDDPRLLSRYYGDVLFYRTALNNTTWFLVEQRRLAESLERLIEDRYGLVPER